MSRYFILGLGLLGLMAAGSPAWADRDQDALKTTAQQGSLDEQVQILDAQAAENAVNAAEANPDAAAQAAGISEIVLRLLRDGERVMFDNPSLAARFFQLALGHWETLTLEQVQEAIPLITAMLQHAKNPAFQAQNPAETAQILDAMKKLAGKVPSDQAPGLFEQVLTAAQDFAQKNPNTQDPTVVALAEKVTEATRPTMMPEDGNDGMLNKASPD